MDLLDRLKAVKRPSLTGSQKPAEQPPPSPPNFLAVRTSGPHSAAAGAAAAPRTGGITISPVWLGAIGVVLAAWIAWIAYSAADHGIDAGVGVFVAWPTLLVMAAIVTAPFALIAVLLYRTFRG